MTKQERECPSCAVEYNGDGHELCFDCAAAYRKMEEHEQYMAEIRREMRLDAFGIPS